MVALPAYRRTTAHACGTRTPIMQTDSDIHAGCHVPRSVRLMHGKVAQHQRSQCSRQLTRCQCIAVRVENWHTRPLPLRRERTSSVGRALVSTRLLLAPISLKPGLPAPTHSGGNRRRKRNCWCVHTLGNRRRIEAHHHALAGEKYEKAHRNTARHGVTQPTNKKEMTSKQRGIDGSGALGTGQRKRNFIEHRPKTPATD